GENHAGGCHHHGQSPDPHHLHDDTLICVCSDVVLVSSPATGYHSRARFLEGGPTPCIETTPGTSSSSIPPKIERAGTALLSKRSCRPTPSSSTKTRKSG